MRTRTVTNVTTGESVEIPYTAEEEQEADAIYATWLAQEAAAQAAAIAAATVTPRQAKLALYASGLLETVETMIAAADRPTQITWAEAIEFRRDDPLINGLGATLGLTSQQIDDLFTLAATL